MLGVEAWTTIRYLNAQGVGYARSVANSESRTAVRHALRSDGAPRYQRPARPNQQLAPYEAQIHRWYFGQHLIGSRILRELSKLGYTGGPTAVYAYLKQVRAAAPSSKATVRFETPPGRQGQFPEEEEDPEDSSRPAFIPRWSRPRDDLLSRHLAHFFVGAHSCRSTYSCRRVDSERARRMLARLGADLDGLWDALGDVEVVGDLAAAVVQRDLDWLTGLGGQRGRVELHRVHGLDGQLLRCTRGRRSAAGWLARAGGRAGDAEWEHDDEGHERCAFHEIAFPPEKGEHAQAARHAS